MTSRLPAIERRLRSEQAEDADLGAAYPEPDATPRWRAAPPDLQRDDAEQEAVDHGVPRHSRDHVDPPEWSTSTSAGDERGGGEDAGVRSAEAAGLPGGPATPDGTIDESASGVIGGSSFSPSYLDTPVPETSVGSPDEDIDTTSDVNPDLLVESVSPDAESSALPTFEHDVEVPIAPAAGDELLPSWSDLDASRNDQFSRGRHHSSDPSPTMDAGSDIAAPGGFDPTTSASESDQQGAGSDAEAGSVPTSDPVIGAVPEVHDTAESTAVEEDLEPDDVDARAEQLLAMMAARRAAQQSEIESTVEPERVPEPGPSGPDDAFFDVNADAGLPVDEQEGDAAAAGGELPEAQDLTPQHWLPAETPRSEEDAAPVEHDDVEDRAAQLLALRQQSLSAAAELPFEPSPDSASSSSTAPSDEHPSQPPFDGGEGFSDGNRATGDGGHDELADIFAADASAIGQPEASPVRPDPTNEGGTQDPTEQSASGWVPDEAGDAAPLGPKRSDRRRTLPPWQVPSAAMSREFDSKLDHTGRQVVRESPRKSREPDHQSDIQSYDPMQHVESAGADAGSEQNLPPAADTALPSGSSAPQGDAAGPVAPQQPTGPVSQLPPPGWGNVPPPPPHWPPPPLNAPLLPPPPPGGWPPPPPPGQWAPQPPPPAFENRDAGAGAPQQPPHSPRPPAPPQGGPPPDFGRPQPYRMTTPIDDAEVLKRSRQAPLSGWRRTLHTATAGRINPGDSRKNRQMEELLAQIRQPITGDFRIAVLSIKGGVGKTTTTLGLGSALAMARTDRVIAVDANPDRGTLAERVRDQSTRSTVRDLLRDPHIRRYGDVRSHTRMATSRLEILASEQDPAIAEVFREADYRHTIDILRHYYNIILTDCGTGIMHSAMAGVLDLAHAIVLVSSPAIDAARSASATLDWLMQHGHSGLVRDAHVVLSASRPGAAGLRLDKVYEHFEARCRSIHMVPFDPHLAEGADMDFTMLKPATVQAYIELAGAVSEKFSHLRASYDGR
ncbi:MinD/ParA family ATP-binding protein [Mycolicibacterium senegalense]|uniref:MinD/ParA family ATP-binding protein n=1 Tax=Mycolicibacterium senegalense TaxID=1796 RepID=UPI003AAFAD8E